MSKRKHYFNLVVDGFFEGIGWGIAIVLFVVVLRWLT